MSETTIILIALVSLIVLAFILIFNLSDQLKKKKNENQKLQSDIERFKPILNIEAEVKKIQNELNQEIKQRQDQIESTQTELDNIKSKYLERREIL